MTAPTLPLNDGTPIPQIGLGTSPLSDDEVAPLVVAAIEAGYRHIDTCAGYHAHPPSVSYRMSVVASTSMRQWWTTATSTTLKPLPR